MRHILILLICAFQLQVFAGAPAGIAPVIVKGANQGESQFGVITSDFNQQRPDALSILRSELNRQAAAADQRAQQDGVFKSTNKRFAPESLTFFIAMGAVTFNSMWIKSHGDPLAMERQIMSLKDPISHISFYSFMQTQGFYMNFHAKRAAGMAMDASTHSQMMRRLSYQGMAVGSLASSIVADLGQSVKMCVNKWIKGRSDEQSLASCNQAWRQWNVRDKFSQYFPQIISMWASQAATELIEKTASRGFSKVASMAFMRNILSKDFLVRQAYKVSAADVVLTFGGGGWFTKSVKFVGKVTQFGLFVSVDHILSNYTYRPINNLIKPALFDFDAVAINKMWLAADRSGWDTQKAGEENLVKFEKQIDKFGTHMQEWRDHLNQDAESDLAGWMELTKKMLSQMDYSYRFYRGFASFLHQYLNIGTKINNKQLGESAAAVITRYPMRTLPFYGVRPSNFPGNTRLEDLYIISPNELENMQKNFVLSIAKKLQGAPLAIKKADEKQSFNRILAKLASGNNNSMASGLNDINETISLYELEMRQENHYSMTGFDYIMMLRKLRQVLGNPRPVIYEFAGYSQAFSELAANQVAREGADFGKWSILQKYKFNKESDLMMFMLICGSEQAKIKKTSLAGVNILSPQFYPPTLMSLDPGRSGYCSSYKSTENMYSTPINGQDMRKYILHHTNWSAIGDFQKDEDPKRFELWWFKNAKQPMAAEFRGYDQKFKQVFQKAFNNFFDHRNFYKWAVDGLNQSRYLPNSLQAALKFESNLYLQIMNRALISVPLEKPPAPVGGTGIIGRALQFTPLGTASAIVNEFSEFNYVEHAKKDSETMGYSSIYKKAPREIMQLHGLMENYYSLISNKGVSFDQYIAASKKIDGAISDILVLAGLKKVVAQVNNEVEDLTQPPSASGSEDSVKVYEDIDVRNPSYRQRMVIAAVQGMHRVESEIRRFIRMRVSLSRTLDIDTQEFMADWNNTTPPRRQGPKTNPFGAH